MEKGSVRRWDGLWSREGDCNGELGEGIYIKKNSCHSFKGCGVWGSGGCGNSLTGVVGICRRLERAGAPKPA